MNILLNITWVLVEVVAIAALADLVAGFVHWLEDAYFTAETPVIGPLFIRPNIVHHHFPRHFTRLGWWESSRESFLLGAALLAGALALGVFTWQVALFVVLSVNANQIHKWSHRTRAENGRVISWLQDMKILQTPRHHGLHHTDPKNTFYCPITNFVNPVLERVQLWSWLERAIEALTGIRRREDTAVRGQGPGPSWLAEFRPRAATVVASGAGVSKCASSRAFPPAPGRPESCVKCGRCARREALTATRH